MIAPRLVLLLPPLTLELSLVRVGSEPEPVEVPESGPVPVEVGLLRGLVVNVPEVGLGPPEVVVLDTVLVPVASGSPIPQLHQKTPNCRTNGRTYDQRK